MSKFNAVEAVDELSYDFNPFVNVSGIVPEPSSKTIRIFQKRLRTLMAPGIEQYVELQEMDEKDKLRAAMRLWRENADEGDVSAEEAEDDLFHAISDLCGGAPAYEDLKALPHRVAQAFVGFVTETFISPESKASVTKA